MSTRAGFRLFNLCSLSIAWAGCAARIDAPGAGGPRAARLVYRVTVATPDGFLSQLTADDVARLASSGIRLTKNALVYPDVPVRGEWVELAGVRYMTDVNGNLTLPTAQPDEPAMLGVYRQYSDETPFAQFATAGAFAGVGKEPPATPLVLQVSLPTDMNPTDTQPIRRRPEDNLCPLRPSLLACDADAKPCCVDFNGPKGDMMAYAESLNAPLQCAVRRWRNFEGSTCWFWSFAAELGHACINERAFWQLPNFPNCWRNHKYRNCQHLDPTAFQVTPLNGLTVQAGGTLSFQILNNTKANETVARIDGEGGVAGRFMEGPDQGLFGDSLHHYDDAAEKHFNQRTLTFVAPAHVARETENRVTFMADGRTFAFRVDIVAPLVGHWSLTADLHNQTQDTSIDEHKLVTADFELAPSGLVDAKGALPLTGTARLSVVHGGMISVLVPSVIPVSCLGTDVTPTITWTAALAGSLTTNPDGTQTLKFTATPSVENYTVDMNYVCTPAGATPPAGMFQAGETWNGYSGDFPAGGVRINRSVPIPMGWSGSATETWEIDAQQ